MAAWFKTKHSHLWWPIHGRDDSAGTKHDRLCQSNRGHDFMTWVHVEVNWAAVGMAEGEVVQRTWRLTFYVSFSEVVISSFEDMWNIRKQHVYLDTTPLMYVQYVHSSLGHAMFHLAQIVTVDSNFLNRSSIPVVDLVFKPLAVDFY